jgi:hypothetical protein
MHLSITLYKESSQYLEEEEELTAEDEDKQYNDELTAEDEDKQYNDELTTLGTEDEDKQYNDDLTAEDEEPVFYLPWQ